MKTITLNGTWQLCYCNPGEGETLGWPANGSQGHDFIVAQVPGDVHLDLLAAGLIEEPLYSRNALDCQWVAEKDWWYSRQVVVPPGFIGDRLELHCAGLDTTADLWVNGRPIGHHDNMFVPCRFDLTDLLHEGLNLIVIRLDAGTRAAQGKEVARYSQMGPSMDLRRMWVRKAQFSFQWDWAPRLLTCGIWRGIEIKSYDRVALRDVCLRTSLQPGGRAHLLSLLELENFTPEIQPVKLKIGLTGQTAHVNELHAVLQPDLQAVTIELDIPDPALWWPAPLGQPNLYDVQVDVAADEVTLDQTCFRYGLREVSLVREPLGAEGESFTLAVNGQKVFCKGADWVPADSLMGRVTPAKYRELVRLAAEANFNMFRIWGGGIYEDPCFYDLCDEFGILVWQDFLYACAYYPDDDPAFVSEARREAELAVRQLRNHPCLALWCGNNENQWIHYQQKQQGQAPEQLYGEVLYDQVLPEVCARLDPTRPYWPSSPWGGEDPNSEGLGDRHHWYINILNPDPETRADYETYADDRGKFISEFGVLAPPARESLEKFLPPGELRRDSQAWAFHNNEFEKGNIQLALQKYWKPADQLSLAEYVLWAQLIQAEALKFALEHWRRRKFNTSGALFWMYSDCWGAVGWTVVDYYLRLKPSYYFVRRAFEPVLASISRDGDRVLFWLTNDTLRKVPGRLEYGLVNLHTSKMQPQTIKMAVPPNASIPAAELDISNLTPGSQSDWAVYSRYLVDGQVISRNRLFLAGFNYNKLRIPPARYSWEWAGGQLTFMADSFVWQVQIKAPTGIAVDDNYFDLLPGEERLIHLRGPAELFDRVSVDVLNK